MAHDFSEKHVVSSSIFSETIYTVYKHSIRIDGGNVTDLLLESLALQRIDLVARLVAAGGSTDGDRALAIAWIAELTMDLVVKLDEYEQRIPQNGGCISEGRNLQ
ncbi:MULTISPECIES: hypothetical protein [Yersinia]|uniref:hypothetical protein n=1 Tax=Yersinia TaxID=629 RepID=UPI0005E3F541|nr:hypothetical protein [Yersinia pseudotuberculosis]CQH24976.1 Uncharacterised protein [Yersinia pseudotuberculosis]